MNREGRGQVVQIIEARRFKVARAGEGLFLSEGKCSWNVLLV
jgi:hypothetical protein